MFDRTNGSSDSNTTTLELGGRTVRVTDVFWKYWYLAAERQAMFFRRATCAPKPWTSDPILSRHRFTNAYRASDRVSQYLLHNVVYNTAANEEDVLFRVLLFKIFNKIDTWEFLRERVGEPMLASFDPDHYCAILDERFSAGRTLYSAAYIMPSPSLGHARKHANHVYLLAAIVEMLPHLLRSRSLRELYEQLLSVASFGPFLAFQYAIDLNYTEVFDFDEMEFVVAGPGAVRGIRKCFADTGGLEVPELIRAVTDAAPTFLAHVPGGFRDLWGRPLHLIDCQNLFCEVDKYARVAFPEVGGGGPTRIKQNYSPDESPLWLGYPPKWGLPLLANAPRQPPVSVFPT
jgi:hypothetical protein